MIKFLTRKLHFTEFWALRDISFSLQKGERLGVLGFNGAGKSTLLKVLSGVMKPTKGSVTVHGTICAAFWSWARAFDMNLHGEGKYLFYTARRWAFLGSLWKQNTTKFLEFSELQEFIDVPMKNYSSGMRARLGFAVATVVDPEVLILDEVLSVGDARFRQKSEAKIMNMFDKGTTVVFVSHNTDQVRRICNRAILLQKGQIIAQGTTEEVCAIYDEMTKKNKGIKDANCLIFSGRLCRSRPSGKKGS